MVRSYILWWLIWLSASRTYGSLSPEVNLESSQFSQYILKDTDCDYPLKTYPLFIGSHKE